MDFTHVSAWYRGWIQGKTRIALSWAFAILLVFFAREYPTGPGIIVCLLGATIRFWASGYIRKDLHPAVGGPYSFTRNPLYFGTYLMAIGIIWSIGNITFFIIVTILFAAIYHFIILDEENKLKEIFKTSYLSYQEAVPRFFPRPWRASKETLKTVNPNVEQHNFSWDLAIKNKAYEAYASFFGLVGFVYLVAYIWKKWT